MKTTTTNWVKWIVVGGGALLLLSIAAGFLMTFLWRGAGGMGYAGCNGWDDWGMMGGWGNTGMMMGYNPFGWLGMFLGLLFPLGLLALLVGGAVWLLRNRTPQL